MAQTHSNFNGVLPLKELHVPCTTDDLLTAEVGPAVNSQLTPDEYRQLELCESVIQRGLDTCFEVGHCLLVIRNSRLYRSSHLTFEDYCRERWGLGRSYAWRVIGAAERVQLLGQNTVIPKPANEYQIRPFLKLKVSEFPKLWEKVVKKAGNRPITGGLIRDVLDEFSREKGVLGEVGKSKPKPRPHTNARLGNLLALLHDAKRRLEKGECEQVREILDRIESLL